MNTIGKILVVFVAVCSLGFLAFVAALRNGGTDWASEMRSPELQKEFVFTAEPGEKVMYSVKHRRTDKDLEGKTPVLAEVVLRARKRLDEDANKKLQELSPQPQVLQDSLKALQEIIPIDKAGVEAREKSYNERIHQLWKEMEDVGVQFSTFTLQTQDVLKVAQERREEGYRLSNQLEILRNDKFAAAAQQRVLEDELTRLEENRRRLERRQNQLKKQLGDYDGPG